MKQIISFAASLTIAVAALSSCQKLSSSTGESEVVPGNDLITFYVQPDGIDMDSDVSTRASEVKSLDSFNVVTTTGNYGSETTVWGPVAFTKKSQGSSIYSADKYWPVSDPGYHFYASNVDMSMGASCTVTGDSGTDIVCAYLGDPVHKTQNQLTFKHIYSRIGKVTINTQTGYTISDVSMSISCPVSGTYDIYAGNTKTDGTGWTPGVSKSLTVTNGSNDIYVVPGDYTLKVSYTLTKGNWQQSFNKTASVTLEKGKVSVLEGTATGGQASEIELSITVEDWKTKDVSVVWNNN